MKNYASTMGNSVDSVEADVENITSYHREQRSLLGKTNENKQSNKSKKNLMMIVPALILISVVIFLSKSSSTSHKISSGISSSSLQSYDLQEIIQRGPRTENLVFESLKNIKLRATNEYGEYTGNYPWFADYPGSQLVEPYKQTTLELLGEIVTSGKHSFVWSIENDDTVYTGVQIKVQKNVVGLHSLSVDIYETDTGTYKSTFKTTLIVKYVKREIRALTIADRENFLNAAHKIWEYSTADGRAIYGDKFTGIHTYVKEHAVASGDLMCDQFHEGTGFLPHHLALSNSFEASMRSVDPSVSLHYWDFSIEGQKIEDAGMTPSYMKEITEVFSKHWFGSVDENNHIADSRWAHSTMPKVTVFDSDSTSQNAYGYIRSVWNSNSDREVVRHMFDNCGLEDKYKVIPSCDTHFSLMDAENLGEFLLLSPTDGHGPVHVQIGGMFGQCEEALVAFNTKWASFMDKTLTKEEIEEAGLDYNAFVNKWGTVAQRRVMFNKVIVGEWFHIYRGLWRSHMCAADNSPELLECPTQCDEGETCVCSVNKLITGETTWQNLLPCFLSSDENQEFFSHAMNTEFIKDAIYMMATGSVKEGEMLHSGSPADIIFWLVHPVIERLLAAKRVSTVTSFGDETFYKWSNDASSTDQDWLEYSYYNLAKGTNLYHKDEYICKGHGADDHVLPDMLPLSSHLIHSADADKDGQVSNWELYTALDPNNILTTDYVFDNFKWDHCTSKVTQSSKGKTGNAAVNNVPKSKIIDRTVPPIDRTRVLK